eukprot:CAMPEP_0185275604 /NCGR_PEP_ID=MMETSP1359-20130426/54326_1 /TAXON_ID=552665 /ORGANISM="Bigelowiella longifila, Strain CCMP242" /LENGTH=161 /DNA_ID=CAMNT_0027868999 /DNA_START=60 /DNA_END=545 /DNA_ORIENTATION=+
MDIVRKFVAHGLVHGDLNEFNLLLEPRSGNVTVIDFPQMISKQHPEAAEWLSRDVDCVKKFFKKRFGKVYNETIDLHENKAHVAVENLTASKVQRLDRQLKVSGCYGDDQQSAVYERHRKELLNSNIADDDETFQLQNIDLDALWDAFAKQQKQQGHTQMS